MRQNVKSANNLYGGARIAATYNKGAFGLDSLDILFSVLIIYFFSPRFWEIASLFLPSSRILSNPNTFDLLQAAIFSLGFVGIAVKWELMARIIHRFAFLFIMIGAAALSIFWSIDKAQTIKSTIYLGLIISFATAIGLRFGESKLANIALISSFSLLIAQMLLSISKFSSAQMLAPSNFEISYCLVCAFWAMSSNTKYALFYAPIVLFCGAIVILNQDIMGISALISIAGAYCVIFFSRLNNGEIISISGSIGVLVLLATFLVLGFGQQGFEYVAQILGDFSLKSLIGNGYGLGQGNIQTYLIDGLGLIGILLGVFFVFFAALVAILNAKNRPSIVIAIFGFLALVLANFPSIEYNWAILIFLFASNIIGLIPSRKN